MFIHVVRFFLTVTDSGYDPFDSVHYKDSVFKPAEKSFWSIFGLGMKETVTKENSLMR